MSASPESQCRREPGAFLRRGSMAGSSPMGAAGLGRRLGWLLVALVVSLSVGACGGGQSTTRPGPNRAEARIDPALCGLAAFAKAPKPVEVTFWHQVSLAQADWLTQAIRHFNASQHDVHVSLDQFPSYRELMQTYLAGLSTGHLPDLFQPEDTTVQKLVDSRSVVPVQACVDAEHFPLSDFLGLAHYSYRNVLYALPWNVSNPVLYYNRTVFQNAGLDPDKPPTSFAQVKAYSRQITQSHAARYGIVLRVEPYVFEFLNAKAGGTLVNNGNGRDARATAATLDTPTELAIWTWWNDMVASGLALNAGGAPYDIRHIGAVGTGEAAMTIEASSALGEIKKVLESGAYPTVKIGIAPLPSPNGSGSVPVGDGSLWISRASSPQKRAAAWQVIKYLTSNQQEAALAVALGYAPIRRSATSVPALQQAWAHEPQLRTAYDQLTTGPESTATAGALIGDYQGVRDAVKDGLAAMLIDGLTPQAALQQAERQANTAIQTYNARVSGG